MNEEIIKKKYEIINQAFITREDFSILTGLKKYVAGQEFNRLLVTIKKNLEEQDMYLPSKNKYLPTDLVLKLYPAINRKSIERTYLQIYGKGKKNER